jgi:7-carboxy-7-deazaguanine synthase
MSYVVHEIFLTAQGEGANIGRVAVFCRFAGCNLWSGREADRASAVCRFCDTEFVGGVRYDVDALANAIEALWPADQSHRRVVFTGGEPLLQLDVALVSAMRGRGFWIAIETNGTRPLPEAAIDWVCVSPKAGAKLLLDRADELKLVVPQEGIAPGDFTDFPAQHHWLSPMDCPDRARHTAYAAEYCLAHPAWRLAIQAHKVWGLA